MKIYIIDSNKLINHIEDFIYQLPLFVFIRFIMYSCCFAIF